MFEIICKELTPERKRILAEKEVVSINKPLRTVIAVGGAWIFYYGTGDAPASMQKMSIVFTVIGIAAVLFAIFSQKILETGYFTKASKKGWFPGEASVGEGGVFIRRRDTKKTSEAPGVTSVNAEKFYAYTEVGKVADFGDYFKIELLREKASGVFLFKEDFGKGDPETLKDFIHIRSK